MSDQSLFVQLFALVVGGDFLVYSTTDKESAHQRAKHYARELGHSEWQIVSASVPVDVAVELAKFGTNKQDSVDGNDAFAFLAEYKMNTVDSGGSAYVCDKCGMVNIAEDLNDLNERETEIVISGVCKECRLGLDPSDREFIQYLIASAVNEFARYEGRHGLSLQYRIEWMAKKLAKQAKRNDNLSEREIDYISETLAKVASESKDTQRVAWIGFASVCKWLDSVGVIDEIVRGLNAALLDQYVEMLKTEREKIAEYINKQTKFFECEANHCDNDCDSNNGDCECACDCHIDIRIYCRDGGWVVCVGDGSYDQDHRGFVGSGCIGPQDDAINMVDDLISSVE